MCLAGPWGDGFRELQGPGAKLIATIEASSRFEAMTKYYAMFDRGPYTPSFESERDEYPEEWRIVQLRGMG